MQQAIYAACVSKVDACLEIEDFIEHPHNSVALKIHDLLDNFILQRIEIQQI